jgi:hypothetical protein
MEETISLPDGFPCQWQTIGSRGDGGIGMPKILDSARNCGYLIGNRAISNNLKMGFLL